MATLTSTTTSASTTTTVMAKSKHTVRALRLNEYKEAALTLAEAFASDQVGRYFLDTPARANWTEKQKWELHLSIFEYLTYAHILAGLGTTAGEDYGCVALWMPPHTTIDTLYTTLRSGLWRLHYKLDPLARARFFTEFFPLLHHTKSRILGAREDEAHYLVYLGTRASSRGKGLARAVIECQMAKADEEGRAAYLESSNVVNLGFYRRLGFEVLETLRMGEGSAEMRLDCMVRETRVTEDREEEKGCGGRGGNRVTEKKPRIEVVVKDVKKSATGKMAEIDGEKRGSLIGRERFAVAGV